MERFTTIDAVALPVPRPNVDLSVLTPAQIAAELGECRRAVNINNIADTGVLL